MMFQHGDDTTSGNFLQIRPENGFAPYVGAAPKPPAARTAAHWRCPWLVAGGVGDGGGGALASRPLTCGRCSWVLGAGARGSMDSSEARRDRPECGRRCERGCSAQRPARARDALAIRSALRSPAEALWPRGGGLRCSPPGLGTSSPPPAVPQRPAPAFERTKPRPRPAAFSQPGTLLSSGLRLDPGSCHLLRPCGVGCGRGGRRGGGGGTARYREPVTPSAEQF